MVVIQPVVVKKLVFLQRDFISLPQVSISTMMIVRIPSPPAINDAMIVKRKYSNALYI
jgi:hypothetical protein